MITILLMTALMDSPHHNLKTNCSVQLWCQNSAKCLHTDLTLVTNIHTKYHTQYSKTQTSMILTTTVFSGNENHIKWLPLLSTVFILRAWDMIYIKLLTGRITEGGSGKKKIILHIFELPDNDVRFYSVSCTLLNGRIQSWHINESTW